MIMVIMVITIKFWIVQVYLIKHNIEHYFILILNWTRIYSISIITCKYVNYKSWYFFKLLCMHSNV